MGMFDTIFVNVYLLPLNKDELELFQKTYESDIINCQTKDLDCDLTEIYITDEGDLKINRWEYEEVPKEERPHPNAEGLLGLAGSLRRINQRLEMIYHNGTVVFYTDIGDLWYEFTATFTNGKLDYIEGGKEK